MHFINRRNNTSEDKPTPAADNFEEFKQMEDYGEENEVPYENENENETEYDDEEDKIQELYTE